MDAPLKLVRRESREFPQKILFSRLSPIHLCFVTSSNLSLSEAPNLDRVIQRPLADSWNVRHMPHKIFPHLTVASFVPRTLSTTFGGLSNSSYVPEKVQFSNSELFVQYWHYGQWTPLAYLPPWLPVAPCLWLIHCQLKSISAIPLGLRAMQKKTYHTETNSTNFDGRTRSFSTDTTEPSTGHDPEPVLSTSTLQNLSSWVNSEKGTFLDNSASVAVVIFRLSLGVPWSHCIGVWKGVGPIGHCTTHRQLPNM